MRILHTSIMCVFRALLVTGPWGVRGIEQDKVNDSISNDRANRKTATRPLGDGAGRPPDCDHDQRLDFYGIETGERKQMLEEMGKSLSTLSRDQMTEVITRLNAAALATDPSAASRKSSRPMTSTARSSASCADHDYF